MKRLPSTSAPVRSTPRCVRASADDALIDFETRQSAEFRGVETAHCTHTGRVNGQPCAACARDYIGSETRRPAVAATPSAEEHAGRAVEDAIIRAVFPRELERRAFFRRVGKAAAVAMISSLIPFDKARLLAAEPVKPGDIEKKDLTIGFIPITCATPIIMAEPMGFYAKHGLNATVRRAAGWAMIRDWTINGDVDAAHMLSPMPLAITMGVGSKPVNFLMPAIENINGQAITLHIKHKDKVKGPQVMKGFRFCVPFDYSMHNYLLRYYLAEGGLDPDKDVSIRVVPPAEMVANLKADNVDGYLAPDPFNQRAVYENAGFIFKLTKDLWAGHPCCAFAITEEFTKKYPNTFRALWSAIIDASYYSSDPKNREEIAKAIAPANYLNQPEIVLRQVLTGRYATGLGDIANVPDRIDFDPVPWQAMAKWILSQMVRWKQVPADVDYDKIATQVYLEAGCSDLLGKLGHKPKRTPTSKYTIMGKEFDAANARAYAASFAIPAKG